MLALLTTVQPATAQHYAMPDVPDSIAEPAQRADYAILHYWQRYDFADTTLLRNGHAEQALVEFLGLMPYATERGRNEGIGRWLQQADRNTTACRYFLSQAERYLYHPDSPLRNEQLFRTVLQQSLRLASADAAMQDRSRFLLRLTGRNAVGNKAESFVCETSRGQRLSTDSIQGPLLLICYDPECERCQDLLFSLRYCSPLNLAIKEGRMTVLAVYTGGDEQLWRNTSGDMPAQWLTAIDRTGIGEKMLYDLTAMPVMLLTDSQRRVIMKEPTLQQLTDWLIVRGVGE